MGTGVFLVDQLYKGLRNTCAVFSLLPLDLTKSKVCVHLRFVYIWSWDQHWYKFLFLAVVLEKFVFELQSKFGTPLELSFGEIGLLYTQYHGPASKEMLWVKNGLLENSRWASSLTPKRHKKWPNGSKVMPNLLSSADSMRWYTIFKCETV
jgi:hypothetical protein